jgi:tRNA nucleotidyltransferase (CCA-adding enzyme)
MKTFLVGGAVRDQLLNFPVTEKDWVVVGETPDSMLAKGFKPVGKDFPVFLHPKTQDEYALARTERKTGPGYKGFMVYSSPEVNLEQDLIRRDLTVNAMAIDEQGHLIDPYHGQRDLENKVLRHVSEAFKEDPVRILRVARFAARYAHIGFTVAEETLQMMRDMVADGEAQHLVAERVWAELNKALNEKTPSAFFRCLKDCNALAVIFPEIDALFGIPQPAKYHPEIDTGLHTLLCIDQAALLSDRIEVRFATLLHDLGKAVTDPAIWPSHHGHEKKGLPLLERFCVRNRIPNQLKHIAARVMEYHTHSHRAFEMKPATIEKMFYKLGIYKHPENLDTFLLACEADAKGRTGLEHNPYPQAQFLKRAAQAAIKADTSPALRQGLENKQIGEAIRQIRVNAIAEVKSAENQKS